MPARWRNKNDDTLVEILGPSPDLRGLVAVPVEHGTPFVVREIELGRDWELETIGDEPGRWETPASELPRVQS